MSERARAGSGRRHGERRGLYFLLAMLGTLLLDLPGIWLLPAAALSVGFLLLFLLSVRGGRRRAPASRANPPADYAECSVVWAQAPGNGIF